MRFSNMIDDYYIAPRIFRSDNAGFTWSNVGGWLNDLKPPSPWGGKNYGAHRVVVDQGADHVFVGTGAGVFYTTDGGLSWISTGMNENVVDIAYDPARRVLYAAAYGKGVYATKPGASSIWRPISEGLESCAFTFLKFDATGSLLYAGTTDRGVWRLEAADHNAASPQWTRYR
ncbi:hypothetical protein LLG95_17120 [bacterium]|nr:hypothetical protein [bacterium]